MTSIRYYIPEDGDVESQPNVFLAPKSRQHGTPPTLGQVKQSFPLPGRYHFRFKTSLGGNADTSSKLAVWMDCTDDRQPVYSWKNQIVAKVTRLGVEEDDDEDDDDDEDFQRPPPQQQQQPQQQQVQQSQQQQQPRQPPPPQQQATPAPKPVAVETPSFDIFDAPNHHHSSSGASPNLLDGHAPHGSTGGSHHANLLDMSFSGSSTTPSAAGTTASNSHHHDFLGMTATPTPPVSGNYHQHNAFGGSMPPQQQQQQQQQIRPPHQQHQAFNSFSNTNNKMSDGPFGGLGTPWK